MAVSSKLWHNCTLPHCLCPCPLGALIQYINAIHPSIHSFKTSSALTLATEAEAGGRENGGRKCAPQWWWPARTCLCLFVCLSGLFVCVCVCLIVFLLLGLFFWCDVIVSFVVLVFLCFSDLLLSYIVFVCPFIVSCLLFYFIECFCLSYYSSSRFFYATIVCCLILVCCFQCLFVLQLWCFVVFLCKFFILT